MIEENRSNEAAVNTSDGALLAKYRKFEGKNSNVEKSRRPQRKCYHCGSTSHLKKDCNANIGAKKGTDALCCSFIACGDSNDWYNDSGATKHMSKRREWFRNFETLDEQHPVRIGNGNIIYAIGKGDIDVLAYDGCDWQRRHLAGVYFVPNLVVNLFSQGSCLDLGGKMIATSDGCEFKRNGEIVAVGVRETNLYKMMIRVLPLTIRHAK